MKIILYAIPGFIFLILVEWLYGLARGRNTYRVADTITSISLGSISRLRGLFFLGLGSWFYTKAADGYHLFELPDKGVGIWLFALLAYDFSYYWFHRISHEVNLFWAAHVVHHQSEDYNLGTALRQSGSGLFGFIFYLPWLYVGIPPEILFASGAINLVYQFWVHTEHVPKLGPFEYIFVTASNHRVHHAQNRIYIDRNYGGIFIIWDRLFGSFQEELAEEPCIYGIRKPLKSYNPFWANVHVYWSVLLDSWHARRWRDKFKVWFKGPGWRPAGLDESHPVEMIALEEFSKFDPVVTRPVRIYAFFQFFCATLASTGLLVVATDWASKPMLLAIGLIFFSFYLQGAWTEGRPFTRWLEWLKLGMVFVVLAYLPLKSTMLLMLQVYLLISVLSLIWLSVNPTRTRAPAVVE
jgi:sterol desaturase/sphingolipid hydroxylase (fatty acid hydroxylase superfamily)